MTQPHPSPRDPTEPLRPRHPFLLKMVLWVFLLFTVLGWFRFGGALAGRELFFSLLPPRLYGYLLGAGFTWGTLGLAILYASIRKVPWALKMIGIGALFYPATHWFERLVLWTDPGAGRNWLFVLLLTVLWFGLVTLTLLSSRVRRYFEGKEE